MTAHDLLDGFSGLVGVVEGNGADVMVEDMGLNDAVHQLSSDESKFTVDGRCGATSIRPGLGKIMRKGGVGVLQIGNGH